jgi:hypothetical protein
MKSRSWIRIADVRKREDEGKEVGADGDSGSGL